MSLIRRYWLYGEIFQGEATVQPKDFPKEERPKGWFPRKCALEIMNAVREEQIDTDDTDCTDHVPECSVNPISSKKDQ